MSHSKTINRAVLGNALHYGSPLSTASDAPGFPFDIDTLAAAKARRDRPEQDSSALLDEGTRLWKAVCSRAAEKTRKPLLLPLSAGLDSRAVLAGLRANDIPVHTMTYGVPGAFDYELAPQVAKAAGASNERLDLQSVPITRERLLEVAADTPRPSLLLDMFFNHQITERHGDAFSYINGFAGDALAGNNLKSAEGFLWPQATQAFARWHQVSRTLTLTDADMDPLAALPRQPLVEPSLLPSIQQLDFAIRQQCMVRPIVCPPGVDVITPFLDPEWCVFMLGLPEALRHDRSFFIELFRSSFPSLFSLPSSASGGLALGAGETAIRRHRKKLRRRRRLRARIKRIFPAVRVPPANRGWQYLDFRTLLREDGSLALLFADSMARLDEQALVPWIDAQALLRSHRAYEADHFKALNVLLNVELLLDARPDLFESDG